MAGLPDSSVNVVRGLPEFMNMSNVNPRVNAEERTRGILGMSGTGGAQTNPLDNLDDLIRQSMGDLGVALGDGSDEPQAGDMGDMGAAVGPSRPADDFDALIGSLQKELGGDVPGMGDDASGRSGVEFGNAADVQQPPDGLTAPPSFAQFAPAPYTRPPSRFGRRAQMQTQAQAQTQARQARRSSPVVPATMEDVANTGVDLDAIHSDARSRNRLVPFEVASAPYGFGGDPQGGRFVTDEQGHRARIDEVVDGMRDGVHGGQFRFEEEHTRDSKASRLEQIDQLRSVLVENGTDCSAISAPTQESSMEEINTVLRILQIKNDLDRGCSFAEDVILGAAEGMGAVFDGKTRIPIVGWKPDYTGYHNTVSVKLARMRPQMADVMNTVIRRMDLGPLTRMLFELLPSLFLYPQQRARERGGESLANEMRTGCDIRQTFQDIRKADVDDDIEMVRSI